MGDQVLWCSRHRGVVCFAGEPKSHRGCSCTCCLARSLCARLVRPAALAFVEQFRDVRVRARPFGTLLVAGEATLTGKVEHCIGVEFDAPVAGGHDGKLDGVTYFRGRPGYCLIVPRSADRLVPFTAQRRAAAVIAAAARGAAVRMRLRAESLAAFIKTLEEYKETCMNKAMSEMAGACLRHVHAQHEREPSNPRTHCSQAPP